jgi:G3E family GTPase
MIPVTILTGFLGAGKTTVLNSVIAQLPHQRIGVVENEFGGVSIDNELIVGVEESYLRLSNGCLCCTVRGDIVRILRGWLRDDIPLDRVVVETTGMADPAPIAQTLHADDVLRAHFTLDGIVTVVDARHFQVQLQESPEVRRQIAYADHLILNKADLVSETEMSIVARCAAQLNPLARQQPATKGSITASAILGRREEISFPYMRAVHAQVDHGDARAISIEFEGELSAPHFYRWIGDLIAEPSHRLFRCKALIALKGQDRRIVVHIVRDVPSVEIGAVFEGDRRVNRLVIIGRRLDEIALRSSLKQCISSKLS